MEKKYSGMPMRFAHTGVTQFAPENTLEAFKKAAELGCEGIELDIQISGDGEIIVCIAVENLILAVIVEDTNGDFCIAAEFERRDIVGNCFVAVREESVRTLDADISAVKAEFILNVAD